MGLKLNNIIGAQEADQWETLIEQILRGNVIPVIGQKLVTIEDIPSNQYLVDNLAAACGIKEKLSSFTELIYHPLYEMRIGRKGIYKVLNQIVADNPEVFQPTELLRKFLSIPYFPFVITTTFDPIVENTMREIHGDKLRVLSFANKSNLNQDINNISDVNTPTLYYIFGRTSENGPSKSFVVSDTDYLKFARSWLSPSDCNSKNKPYNISQAMSEKYLLVMGCDYQDWLFRFIWYALKEDRLTDDGSSSLGAMTNNATDSELISFLTRSNTFAHIDDFDHFVEHLNASIDLMKPSEENLYFSRPMAAPHVFLSYSRADSIVVEKLYHCLKNKGVKAWFDRENLGAGDKFMEQIQRSIFKSSLFVPILSEAIVRQAFDIHPYRQEWEWAIYKNTNTGGVKYILPFCEKRFESHLEDEKADIPQKLIAYNVKTFSSETLDQDIENFSNIIVDILKHEYGINI